MKFTARNLIIIGFIISFTALLLNAVILSEVNNRLKRADTEFARLNESLQKQTDLGNEGQKKFEDFLMMKHLSEITPAANKEGVLSDAEVLFQEALMFIYAAGNDLSMTEFRRADAEPDEEDAELEEKYEEKKSNPDEKKKKDDSPPPVTEKEKTAQELEKLDQALKILETPEDENGKVDYKAKLTAMELVANAVVGGKNEEELLLKFYPFYKLINERFLQNIDKKQSKVNELTAERRHLADLQSYFTFGALALQMLGLAFVFLKDILGQKGKETPKETSNYAK